MISQLYLDIIRNNSGKSFLIKDISLYNPDGPVTCGQLQIEVPGWTKPAYYDVLPNFELLINMSNLGIQKGAKYETLQDLPDGEYYIKYSINPNDKLFVNYVYFNTHALYKSYITKVHTFLETKCDMTVSEQNMMIEKLWVISNNIDLIKIASEECGDIDNAKTIYNKTTNLLDEIW